MRFLRAAFAAGLFLSQGHALAKELESNELIDTVTRIARAGYASSPRFSPDGTRIAYLSDLNGVPQLWIVPSKGGYPELVTNGADAVMSLKWSPKDKNAIAFSSAPGGGMNTQIFIIHPDGTGLRRLTAGGKDRNNLIDWTHDGSSLMMGSNQRDPAVVDPYLLDPSNRQMERLEEAAGLNSLVGVSRDRKFGLISRLISRGSNNVYLLDLKSKAEILLTPHEGPGRFEAMFGADSRVVYLVSNKDRDLTAFAHVKLSPMGQPGPIEVIAARDDADLDFFVLNKQGTQAALVWNVGGRSELGFVDLASGAVKSGPKLPAEIVDAIDYAPNGDQLAMAITGPQAPEDIWVLNIASNKLKQVTFSPHAGVNLDGQVRPELVTYKAEDGLPLSGWLYKPKGQSGRAPYVLSFHGGPEGQERPYFRNWAVDYQALLSQGIGVFAPNVRGSNGFGKRFENLDNGPLRVNGVKDIKASVDYLIATGFADPAHLGIAGGSYGGYMTMAGITEYPNMFAAAVDLFGVVNFETFFANTEPWMASISTTKYGDPVREAAMLRDLSPINKLDRIKAPLLVQQGANDTNVPVIEGEQIVNTLKGRGTPVDYILVPDEGHGIRKTENRIRSTISTVEFFVKYLKPGEPTVKQ